MSRSDRAIVWLDRCRAEGLPRLGGKWGLAFKALGVTRDRRHVPGRGRGQRPPPRDEPETWARIRHYLFLSGLPRPPADRPRSWTRSRRRWATSRSTTRRWRGRSRGDWKWQAAPDRARLAAGAGAAGRRLGAITAAAAEVTGIPAGLPLIAAAGDKACEVLGSGALDPHVGAISLGTTATFNTTHRRYVEVIPLVPPYPAAVPGAYSLEVQVYRGYWMIEWFKREFGAAEVARARELGVDAETLFDELVAATPPGSMGLILQPYWSPGVRIPGPEAKGAVIGWGDVHTRAHLYRAILEGLAYALREGAERTVAAHEGAGDRAARLRRRIPEPGGGPADRRHLRAAGVAPAHARDVRAGGGDRRGRRARASIRRSRRPSRR